MKEGAWIRVPPFVPRTLLAPDGLRCTCHRNVAGSGAAAATVGGAASLGSKGGWSEAGDFANCGYAMFMSKAAKDAAENVVV